MGWGVPGVVTDYAETFRLRNLQTTLVVGLCVAPNGSGIRKYTAVVLRCGKQMEKLPHYQFSWIVSFQKQRYHIS